MLRFSKLLTVVVLSLVLVLAACGGAGSATEAPAEAVEAQTLTVSGAFALFPMMTVWGEQYALANPNVRFDATGGGAGKGITDMLSGVADIAMVSRELKQEEIDQGAFGVPVTIDAVVATVNADNPYIDEILAKG
jgi:phosphate transport system substrate-binding protein